jgi:outer membrane biosynthesis protein TonB
LSIGLHLLILALLLTLLPELASRFASSHPIPAKIVTFRFGDDAVEVDESSRTKERQVTPLIGRHESVARDRVVDGRDTPRPSGAENVGENMLPKPGTGFSPDASEPAAGGTTKTGAANTTPSDPVGARILDGQSSEVAMLTGRREAARHPAGRPARSDSDANGALQFGDFSFSTRAWDYEPYWYYMRERLYANWHPPAAYKDYGIIQGGWTIVRAALDRQGRLLDAKILGTNGHASLHPASLAAMLGAAPFRPLPADFPDDSLVVTVRFMYLPPGQAPPPEAR